MKKEDLKKWNKPQIHLQNNLVDDPNSKTRIDRVVSEPTKTQNIYDFSHKIIQTPQEKIQINNIARVVLGTKKPKPTPKKYATFLLEQSKIDKLKNISYKSGQSQSSIINKLIELL